MNTLKKYLYLIDYQLYILYILILMFVFAIKYHYSIATSDDLEWILKPTSRLVGLILNKPFIKESCSGYVNWECNIIIAKSCAGINFFITAFCMNTFIPLKSTNILLKKIQFIIKQIIIVYIFTILVNTIRIIISIYILKADIYSGWLTKTEVHKFTGIIIFFTSLCFLHIISIKVFQKRRMIPSLMNPFIWYIIILLLIPLLNGFFTQHNNQFLSYSISVISIALFIIGIIFSIQYIYKRIKNRSI